VAIVAVVDAIVDSAIAEPATIVVVAAVVATAVHRAGIIAAIRAAAMRTTRGEQSDEDDVSHREVS
jgi:hypothetical protein